MRRHQGTAAARRLAAECAPASSQRSGDMKDAASRRQTTSEQLGQPGWTPPRDLNQSQWFEVGRTLGRMGRYSRWWVGDWLLYAHRQWGERYKQASRVTGYDYGTLRNIVSLAQKFELSRRRDNLSWGHHADVASLPREEQDLWLDRASELGLSREDLRVELRAAKGSHAMPSTPGENEQSQPSSHTLVCSSCGFQMPLPAELLKAIRST
jgi:hypothetical protein